MKLDPTALDAAVRAYSEKGGRVGVKHAITAYLTALAPQTRERVDTLINSAQKSMWDDHPDDHERYGAYLSIDKSALLALFGAEEPA